MSPGPAAASGTAVTPPAAATVAVLLADATARLTAARIPTARQDAETLLARVLGTSRLGLYTTARGTVPDPARAAFADLLERRVRHEPVQYLLGEAEFSGLALGLAPGVFIPRPETEALVARALALGPEAAATVVDLCTGSGAIACALAAGRPRWTVWAVERAAPAAARARTNVRRLGLAGRVQVLDGDLYAPLRGRVAAGRADLIVANPPYLARPLLPTLPREVRDWEPEAALDGGADGLDVIRRVVETAPEWLRSGGALLVEIGEEQGLAVRALVGADPWTDVRVHRDFQGCERVLEARRQ